MNQYQIIKALHVQFSPDVRISDFYLFEKVKNALTNLTFEDKNEPLTSDSAILTAIFR
jgi:hypothetical protein